ncbi:MAG: PIN domain-containing protein [Nitrososphaerales archaeon]
MALKAVLDTRFFFALYNPSSRKQEEWCKTVVLESKNKRSASCAYAASCITVSELYENMGRLVGRDVVKLRISSIKESGIQFVPVDEEICERAGDLKLNSGEFPMSDAIIAATAQLFAIG